MEKSLRQFLSEAINNKTDGGVAEGKLDAKVSIKEILYWLNRQYYIVRKDKIYSEYRVAQKHPHNPFYIGQINLIKNVFKKMKT